MTAGAALIAGGQVVAAVNEERLTRRKLEVCFPAQSIRCCLALAQLSPADVDLVAASTGDVAKTLARWFPALKEGCYQIQVEEDASGRWSNLRKRAKYRITGVGTHEMVTRAERHRSPPTRVVRSHLGAPVVADHHQSQ